MKDKSFDISKIKIEKKIPLWKKKERTAGWIDFLSKMEVGDSFEVPENKFTVIWKNAKTLNIKVISRKSVEGKIRVWRTE
jgi:hypothetical protein